MLHPDIAKQLNRLLIPAQDLPRLTFCNATPKHLQQWLQQLPLAQPQHMGSYFYRALPELVRLQASPELRLCLLETLQAPLQHCMQALARFYLNQPLILPEAALKTATLAQALQKHSNNAYLVVVRDLCQDWPESPSAEQQLQLAKAIYRALGGLGLQLMRNYQLYIPINSQVWNEIHALYQLAQQTRVSNMPLALHHEHDDEHPQPETLTQQYLRLLLLACARPNQLRQNELERTYNALGQLASYASLGTYAADNKDNLYLINTLSNQAPFYKWRINDQQAQSHLLEIRTAPLIVQLTQRTATSEERDSPLQQLTPALTQHLIQAWSSLAQRSFERKPAQEPIEVTVGLTNAHYHLANQEPFNVFLHKTGGRQRASFNAEQDPWDKTFDISGTRLDGAARTTDNIEAALLERSKQSYQTPHPVFQVAMFDRSAGGYGLEWRGTIPAQVKTGELLALREKDRDYWSLGVIRWVHQMRNATQLGIQMLAPRALPVALAVVQKSHGNAEYLRALQIPELKIINQPASLVTNALSFHELTKARLYHREQQGDYDKDTQLQLTRRLFNSGVIAQFAYRERVDLQRPEKPDDFSLEWQ